MKLKVSPHKIKIEEEEITNTELINKLESIKSKDGTTNISITSENLPAILNVSALKGDVE